jgi:flagellar hook-length control protein FliK
VPAAPQSDDRPIPAQTTAPLAAGRAATEATPMTTAEPQRRAARFAPPPPAILPAVQAFGAALQKAWAAERKPVARLSEAAIVIAPQTSQMAPATEPALPTLDLADRGWPQAMAERIERLQDAAEATSTRIRLLPDALGAIDVAVKREGELVHVLFTAAEAQTRQLLADAQPPPGRGRRRTRLAARPRRRFRRRWERPASRHR